MRLTPGERAKIWEISNFMLRHGARGRGDDRSINLAGIDLDFTARFESGEFVHRLVTEEWLVLWKPHSPPSKPNKKPKAYITNKGYEPMLRDVTMIMLSGEIYAEI